MGNNSKAFTVVRPGQFLGLLGGGQLGRMFCMAAQTLGYRVIVLDPDSGGPATMVADEHLKSDYLNEAALKQLAQKCAAVTTEFENVPAHALELLSNQVTVSPSAQAVRIAQDRSQEKQYIASQNVPVVPYLDLNADGVIDKGQSLQPYLPGILKTARLGYDGKGQVRVSSKQEVLQGLKDLGQVPCVLEKKLDLKLEVSVIVCRDSSGNVITFPVSENHHSKGILDTCIIPARLKNNLAETVKNHAKTIAVALNYVGVLCVEFFVLHDDSILVNEIAPRPHNSGHYTIDACVTSQFEQQARILAGLPLGNTIQFTSAVMINLLGDLWFDQQGTQREPNWESVLSLPQVKLHLYGKAQPRSGRKMGHITLLAANTNDALEVAQTVKSILGIKT